MTASPPLALFTDLDGCLLNKHDYDFAPALLVLERLQRLEIPVILSSSKTEAEMRPLSVELGLELKAITQRVQASRGKSVASMTRSSRRSAVSRSA